jgi:alginate O-acetyltransferase complex protein AlgI
VRAPFDAPLRSRSLAEFQAQRWNRSFSEMTALAVQRPLAARLGRHRAMLVSFLVSGLLHEVAISLPVGAGFGLPTCYFVLQGLLVARERGAPAGSRRCTLFVRRRRHHLAAEQRRHP